MTLNELKMNIHNFTISNSQLAFGFIFYVILYTTILFIMLYAMGDRLDAEHPFSIQEKGRRLIFIGVPAIGIILLMCGGEAFAHIVGEKAFPYLYFGAMVLCCIVGDFLYKIVPRRWVLPLGIAGWVTSFTFALWYFWFGPGAFGNSTM